LQQRELSTWFVGQWASAVDRRAARPLSRRP